MDIDSNFYNLTFKNMDALRDCVEKNSKVIQSG